MASEVLASMLPLASNQNDSCEYVFTSLGAQTFCVYSADLSC